MSAANRCPRCGTERSSEDAQGLCPQCLLQVGLESRSATSASQPAAGLTPAKLPTESVAVEDRGRQPAPKTAAALPEPGQRFGKYRLIRKLGRGGMGAVFEAEDLESGRRVALKLLAHSLESPEARNRFFREGRLAASINHPNSVYVYGTEEIDGTPAISMEHVLGGTLHDRVRQQGALPVTEAVDAILQIIDGLEAAAAAGVLHRDVKPSNCFVDADGTVKIGDFGLSISTAVRGDTHLTAAGSFLGTPAFSSPEQLRGDELDVRSDIYAVGVTLYYLLTGRTPYEADNLVKLLATVLEQPAPSPAKFRSEIPRGLANVVLRCLVKQPSDRFRNYAELRAALVPYNSTAPTPATLAWRFAAGLCDTMLWTAFGTAAQLAMFRGDFSKLTDPALLRSRGYIAGMVIAIVLCALYFAISEGLWGASLGKAVCRLRVVDRRRNRIGIPRALVRTAIYFVFPGLIMWTYWIYVGVLPFDVDNMYNRGGSFWMSLLVSYSYYVMLAVLFSSARRRNGYSGLHDLAVGSRVIRRTAYQSRPRLEVPDERLPDVDDTKTIGPYHVLHELGSSEAGQFLLGYDVRLLRRVWIHKLPAGSPAVSVERRNMGRVGRLRWINGRRDDGQCWDVYEALSGQPLVKLIEQPQPWSVVRYWLLDLAQELAAAAKDGTLPPAFRLDRVWITAAGRVKLLDVPPPGTPSTGEDAEPASLDSSAPGPAAFLSQVAQAAMHDEAGAMALPVEARTLLNRLPAAEQLEPVCEELQRLARKTPAVTRARRFAMLCVMAAFPVLFAVVGTLCVWWMNQVSQQYPEMPELRYCLIYLELNRDQRNLQRSDAQQEGLEVYIAGKFRETITDPQRWNSYLGLAMIPPQHRKLAERIVAERPAPSESQLAEAQATIEPILKAIAEIKEASGEIPVAAVGAIEFVVVWLLFVALPGLIAAAAFCRGLVMLMFGVDCVTRRGALASRLRMVWRAIVFHAPVILAPIVFAMLSPLMDALEPLLVGTVAALAAVTAWSALLPVRGLADRLAGTYPVPR